MYVNVKGGTNGGWKSLGPAPQAWSCFVCLTQNAGYRAQCAGCSTRRPS